MSDENRKALSDGRTTSEHAAMIRAERSNTILIVVTFLLAAGTAVVDKVPPQYSLLAVAVVAGLAALSRSLVAREYIRGRSEIKANATLGASAGSDGQQ
jgi:hypothetical protein